MHMARCTTFANHRRKRVKGSTGRGSWHTRTSDMSSLPPGLPMCDDRDICDIWDRTEPGVEGPSEPDLGEKGGAGGRRGREER